jgi:AraC-like DNA-binding protein
VLAETFALDPDGLPPVLKAFALGRSPSYFLKTMPLTASVRKPIEEMLSAPYGGRFSHVHAATRAVDLACMVLDVLINDELPRVPRLSAREERTLEAIRSHLAECFMSPPTIAELSRMAGMNRTKLTQGFRGLFQETILEYCQRLRMRRARHLLLEGEAVGRVAAAVGYEHLSSFSQAFKAYYGFAPMESRRISRSQRPRSLPIP